jgi:hypothetical protein
MRIHASKNDIWILQLHGHRSSVNSHQSSVTRHTRHASPIKNTGSDVNNSDPTFSVPFQISVPVEPSNKVPMDKHPYSTVNMTTNAKFNVKATANVDPCSPYNSSSSNSRCAKVGGIDFSSTKFPPRSSNPMSGRLDQTCELPFGFCYTPMARIPQQHLSSTSSPHLPAGVMCVTCMTYLNLYCSVDETRMETEGPTYIMRIVSIKKYD